MDDSEVKLREILDLLLYAGYFRIRIPSLSTFDKILGGLTWCISCSNFEIDVTYHDEMAMGQKIKLAERVQQALIKMGCPYKIQPHQIQGLDFPHLHPIFQWLIKLVMETRDLRQDLTKNMANYLGRRVLREEPDRNPQTVVSAIMDESKQESRRITKNLKIELLNQLDPLRVYSNLIEYDDKTAFRMYNRLCSVYSTSTTMDFPLKRKEMVDPKNKQTIAPRNMDIMTVFAEDSETMAESDKNMGEMKEFARISEKKTAALGQNLYKIMNANRDKLAENIKIMQQPNDKFEFATLIKNENAFFEEEKDSIMRNMDNLEKRRQELMEQIAELEGLFTKLQEEYQGLSEMEGELMDAKRNIDGRIAELKKKTTGSVFTSIQNLIEKQNALKLEKGRLNKETHVQKNSFDQEKSRLEAQMPTFDETVYDELGARYAKMKSRYDEKFKEFAQLNQEIAILQRKIENYPSAVETSQYHQRFIELYDKINFEMEKYRDNFIAFNNKTDFRQTLLSQIETMKSFKEGLIENKTARDREDFVKNVQVALQNFQTHLTKIEGVHKNVRQAKEKNVEAYNQLLNLERQYYSIVKALQVELEKNFLLSSTE